MNVVVIIHQYGLELDDPYDIITDVIGVYKNPRDAIVAFNIYLDALEATWRSDSPVIVFNRFSEKTDNILAYANCINHRTKHSVWAIEEEVQ